MPSNEISLVAQLKNTCATFDIRDGGSRSMLIQTLDGVAIQLARNEKIRAQLGVQDLTLWSDIRKLWRDLVRAQLTFWDGDDEEEDGNEDKGSGGQKTDSMCQLCASLARFTRNIVAGVPANQTKAYENEPEIRRLLHCYTSWTSIQDEQATFAARLLTQALSNLVTGNEPLMSNLWETYLNLPEDQVVIIRLLSSPDTRILLSVLTLIQNCIHDSRTRTKMLVRTPIGSRICVCLLDNMVKLFDADESSEGGLAFDIGYHILTRILDLGLAADLYQNLSIQGEVVTPHQTTLMKIIDSYLQSPPTSPMEDPKAFKIHAKMVPMLATCFVSLSSYAESALRRALRPMPSEVASPTSPLQDSSNNLPFSPPAELDVMLPKVCEMLVLVTQCIVSIVLASHQQPIGTAVGASSSSNYFTGVNESVQVFYHEQYSSSVGFVEHIIGENSSPSFAPAVVDIEAITGSLETLRLLDKFLPRINFGRAVDPESSASASGCTASEPQQSASSTAPGSTGFAYLKRDLVRLLGILCHEQKAVQDRVRLRGGIEVVMNLCVVDERNPYLREHALFTLHNLLKDNDENKAIVEEIKPTGQWDENGVLRDTPGAVRR